MGRTVPSFRLVLAEEKSEWKPFRNALDKKERNEFDQMWDIPRLYVSACSNSVQLVPLHPIVISILFQHYKDLNECIREVEALGLKSTPSKTSYSNKTIIGNTEIVNSFFKSVSSWRIVVIMIHYMIFSFVTMIKTKTWHNFCMNFLRKKESNHGYMAKAWNGEEIVFTKVFIREY
jgi:hypothetical protein